jgi:two-component system chemotaxis response regulator CheY
VVGPAHVLIVDDNADLRGAVSLLLQFEGHAVVEAADGQLALDALSAGTRIGVIILDLMMPVMDGRTFLAHKARGDHAAVPVVIFSSSPCQDFAGFAGVIAVVPKLEGIHGLLAAIQLVGFTPQHPYSNGAAHA